MSRVSKKGLVEAGVVIMGSLLLVAVLILASVQFAPEEMKKVGTVCTPTPIPTPDPNVGGPVIKVDDC